MKEILDQIKKNVVDLITPQELEEKLQNKKNLIVKFGADPTACDLHLGHVVILRKLRQLQRLGHTLAFIIGDFTARIGDPSLRFKERKILSKEETLQNARTYAEQVFKVIDKDKTKVYYNSSWFSELKLEEFLSLLSLYTVQRMLDREDFKKRIAQKIPLSTAEFIYPFLQAYDSIKVKADIEIGGTDQLFNLLVARQIQKDYQDSDCQVVMTMPLLEGTDGKLKMSKSYNNYISINENYHVMYAKLLSIPDYLIIKYMKLLTDIPDEEIEEYQRFLKVNPKEIKIILAKNIVEFFHGKDKAEEAYVEFERVHKKRLVPTKLKEFIVDKEYQPIITLLVNSGLASSRSEAKRYILQKAVRINNKEIITDINYIAHIKKDLILQVGRRKFVKICLSKN